MINWIAVKRRKIGIVMTSITRNRKALAEVLWSPRLSAVRRELRRQPGIVTFLAVPFLSSTWNSTTRIKRIIDHCLLIEARGAPFVCQRNAHNPVCRLPAPLNEYGLAIETPKSMMRDGLLTLVLMKGDVGIFTLSFILATEQNGLAAYVGAVQGSADQNASDIYRSFTREAWGVRPRDFLIEAFRTICGHIGAATIYGVSDRIRHQKSAYFKIGAVEYDQVKLDYDTMWVERGGISLPNGFYRLSAERSERSYEDIPARKRAMYRRRAAMWAEIDQQTSWLSSL
jgi:uncharacterized protein VirK/YbjX